MALPGAFDSLLDEPMWVAWNDEGGRKVPKSPFGGNAKSNDPSTWGTYAEAEAARERNGYSGVGLMLSDGYIGVDLDGAIESDGSIKPWAREIVDSLGSYTEVSPSGTGLHVLAWADTDQVGLIGRADHRSGIEVYNYGRYFTVTGDEVSGGRIYDLTDEIPRFVVEHFSGESPEHVVRRRVGDLASAEVKRMANKTMTDNCVRDDVRYARVPTGSETCGFCIMLASRGFVYHSERTAGELNHYHQNCDCKVIPGFPGMEVEGYDPDALYELYSEARSRIDGRVTDSAISREIDNILNERAGMEKSVIPDAKLTRYALDKSSSSGKDKAVAFELALGFTKDDAGEIMRQVYRWMGQNEPAKTGENQWGELYTADIRMTGKDGKTANVRTGWILRPGEDKMQLTSIYVH